MFLLSLHCSDAAYYIHAIEDDAKEIAEHVGQNDSNIREEETLFDFTNENFTEVGIYCLVKGYPQNMRLQRRLYGNFLSVSCYL